MIMAPELCFKETPPYGGRNKAALSGNLCRCTGYANITDAILSAAEEMKNGHECQ